MQPNFFRTPSELRKWFEQYHETSDEVWIGFYKTSSGKLSVTWPEAVDQALCFGWIDGVRKSLNETSYTIRFTKRRRSSIWSAVNITRAKILIEKGLMMPAGRQAFGSRDEKRSAIYSYERKNAKLPSEYERKLKANKTAWDYFQSQPPWYKRTAAHWVTSAKKEESRQRRLAKLIEDSEKLRSIPPLTRARKKNSKD